MKATFRPLTLWTQPHTSPRRSRWTFKGSWSSTLALLDTELTHLRAEQVVIEADFTEADIRLDGMPRASARSPQFPGIRLSFTCPHGPLAYATDTHEFWQHNVRAIALGLGALRAVDRYGITQHGEQYTGWRALPPGADPEPRMTQEEAWSILGSFGEVPIARLRVTATTDTLKGLHRKARAFAHPDRHGGDREVWDQVEQAAAALGLTP